MSESGSRDEINIDTKNEYSPSLDNPDRQELLWSQRNENLLNTWQKNITKKIKAHGRAGRKNKRIFQYLSIPTIVIPIILSTLSGALDIPKIVMSLLLILVAVINGMLTFFNFGKKSQTHFEYEAKYSSLAGDIELELVKPKAMRIPADVFLHTKLLNVQTLEASEPLVREPSISRKSLE